MTEFESSRYLLHFSAKDFADTGSLISIPSKKFCLVMFYAPWCGHCQAMKNDFANAAKELKDTKGMLATYDSTKPGNSEKMQKFTNYKILGFPMLVLFKNGSFHEIYQGSRTKEDIIHFVLQNIVKSQDNTSIYSTSMF